MRIDRNRHAQATVEYVLILAVVLAAIILAVAPSGGVGNKPTIGGQIERIFSGLGQWLSDTVADANARLGTD